MAYLLWSLLRMRMSGPGWLEFKIFLGTLICWNLLTFSGHWMNEFVDKGKLTRVDGHVVSFHITTLFDAFYYLSRLDHLILVPAFVFLLLALRKWRSQT